MPEMLVVTSAYDHSPARTNSKRRGKQIWRLERAFDVNAKQRVLCLISKVANGRITGRIEKNKNNKSFIILGLSTRKRQCPTVKATIKY